MIGGRGSSSAAVLAGIENSFEALKFVWFIRKFGEGFGISSCRNGICHPPSQKINYIENQPITSLTPSP